MRGTRARAAFLTTIGGVVLLLATGCGGSAERPTLEAAPSSASKQIASASPTTSARPRAVAASGGAPATTTTSWVGHVVLMPDWFTVKVDKQCIHASDMLTAVVRGGMPGQLFIYDTAYANGTSDATNQYGTGSGRGKFDDKGEFRLTFALAGNVPPGQAWLTVASSKAGDLIQTRTSFLIKPIAESCA